MRHLGKAGVDTANWGGSEDGARLRSRRRVIGGFIRSFGAAACGYEVIKSAEPVSAVFQARKK